MKTPTPHTDAAAGSAGLAARLAAMTAETLAGSAQAQTAAEAAHRATAAYNAARDAEQAGRLEEAARHVEEAHAAAREANDALNRTHHARRLAQEAHAIRDPHRRTYRIAANTLAAHVAAPDRHEDPARAAHYLETQADQARSVGRDLLAAALALAAQEARRQADQEKAARHETATA